MSFHAFTGEGTRVVTAAPLDQRPREEIDDVHTADVADHDDDNDDNDNDDDDDDDVRSARREERRRRREIVCAVNSADSSV